MATLTAGQSQQITLQPDEQYTITVGADSESYVDLGAGTTGSGFDSMRLTSGGTNLFRVGEYGRVAKITIRCISGTASYVLGDGSSVGAGGVEKQELPKFLHIYDNVAKVTPIGTGAAKTIDYSIIGNNGATVKINGATAASSTTHCDTSGLSINLVNDDVFELWYYSADTKPNAPNIRFCSDASGFTNFVAIDLSSVAQRAEGWNVLRWHKSEMVATGSIDWSSVKQIRVSFYSTVGAAVFYLDGIYSIPSSSKPYSSITTDDGWSEVLDWNSGNGWATYMASRGLLGSASIIGSLIGSSLYMTNPELKSLEADYGWDLCVHGLGYGESYNNLLEFPTEDLAIDNMRKNAMKLESLNLGTSLSRRIYVYPQGKYTTTLIDKIRKAGWIAARGTAETTFSQHMPHREYLMRIPAYDMGGKTFAQMKEIYDRAKLVRAWVVFYGHRIEAGSGVAGNNIFVKSDEMKAFIDYVAADQSNCKTITLTEMVQKLVG